jgi:hypothetical protein
MIPRPVSPGAVEGRTEFNSEASTARKESYKGGNTKDWHELRREVKQAPGIGESAGVTGIIDGMT